MIEQIFKLTQTNEKIVEKIILDENINYIHMVFNNGEGLPEHYSNAPVYMTVLRGTLTIGLDDGQVNIYEAGTLLKIPVDTKMNVGNKHKETLELIVVKSPSPQN